MGFREMKERFIFVTADIFTKNIFRLRFTQAKYKLYVVQYYFFIIQEICYMKNHVNISSCFMIRKKARISED